MMYKIERKILNNEPLSQEEAYSFLKFVCDSIRKDVGIVDPMDTNCMFCNETSLTFGRLMLLRFGLDVEIIDIKNLLKIPLTHFANIVYLNIEGKIRSYLVDMTFSQFFGDSIRLDDIDGQYGELVSTENSFKLVENDFFVNNLRTNGFIEINNDSLSKYFSYFLRLCNHLGDVNLKKVLKNLHL